MPNDVKALLQRLQTNGKIDDVLENSQLQIIFTKFSDFQKETLQGLHGKTARFYGIYLQLMQYYFILDRSIRIADFDLYCFALSKMNNIFFSVNQHNYARWLVWYVNTLLNGDKTHPGLTKQEIMNAVGV